VVEVALAEGGSANAGQAATNKAVRRKRCVRTYYPFLH